MSDFMIRASEIGEYMYCRRSWWLKRFEGRKSSYVRELAAGRQYHADHGHLVYRSALARRISLALLFIAVLVVVFWLVGQFV